MPHYSLLSLFDSRGGIGPIRSRPARGPGPKKPKTAEELDKELDAFMGDAVPAVGEALQPELITTQDVEMV